MNQVRDKYDTEVAADRESRAESRRRTLFSGKIIFNQQSSVLNCIVRNISESGACLEIESLVGVPERFELLVERAGIRANYRIIWWHGKRIGVFRVIEDTMLESVTSERKPKKLRQSTGHVRNIRQS